MAYFPHSAEEKAAHMKYHNYTTSAIRLRVKIETRKERSNINSFVEFKTSKCSSTISRWKYLYDRLYISIR